MNKPAKKIEWLVWGGLTLIIAAIAIAFAWSRLGDGRFSSLNEQNTFLSSTNPAFPVIGQISDFTLTNQDNEPISLASLRGQIWVADIIFTRCAGPCPRMTHHLAELQALLPPNIPARLVTLTSDPENDTPPVLKKYAARFGADSNVWCFLTGPKPEIRKLAVDDFKFVAVEKKPGERETPEDLFIHSTWFVLVDQQARVRGWNDAQGQLHAYYDSEGPAVPAQILAAIKQLAREK